MLIEHVLFGTGFAFAAAAQPGPLQAFLFAKVADRGVKATLPASLAPLLSDGPVAAAVLLVLGTLPQSLSRVLQGAGGLLLIYLAWAAFRQWRHGNSGRAARRAPHTLLQAVAVNILNPNPYLGWSLVLGPKAISAWRESPGNAVALIGSFYATMVAALALTILLFGSTRFLGTRIRRALILFSSITLFALGLIQFVLSVCR